jgi:hypothetical protein
MKIKEDTVSGNAADKNGVKSTRDKFFYADDDGLLVTMRQGYYNAFSRSSVFRAR